MLIGVGYIIGFRISCVMVAGGMLAALVLTPAIAFFGGAATTPISPGTKLISAMSPKDIRDAYILYIGAGAVATGGIISLFQALPLIVSSIGSGLRDIRLSKRGEAADQSDRTDRDLPLWMVGSSCSRSWPRLPPRADSVRSHGSTRRRWSSSSGFCSSRSRPG